MFIKHFAKWLLFSYVSIFLAACTSVQGPLRTEFKSPSRSERLKEESRTKTQLAIEYMNIKDYRSAVATIEQALKADDDFDIAWLARAQIYQQLKVYDKAEESFRKALSISPNGAEINNNYGWFVCDARDDPLAAMQYFDKALADPTYPSPEISYLNKGICAARSGQYRMAESYFEQALQMNPQFVPVHKERARAALGNHDLNLANREFKLYQSQVAALSPDDLLLGWKISRAANEEQAAVEYEMQLKANFPYSEETKSITGMTP